MEKRYHLLLFVLWIFFPPFVSSQTITFPEYGSISCAEECDKIDLEYRFAMLEFIKDAKKAKWIIEKIKEEEGFISFYLLLPIKLKKELRYLKYYVVLAYNNSGYSLGINLRGDYDKDREHYYDDSILYRLSAKKSSLQDFVDIYRTKLLYQK